MAGEREVMAQSRKVPSARMSCGLCHASFDHLVGAQQKRLKDREVERLGSSEINNEIEFARLLDRNITRFCPAQNLVDKIGGPPETSRLRLSRRISGRPLQRTRARYTSPAVAPPWPRYGYARGSCSQADRRRHKAPVFVP